MDDGSNDIEEGLARTIYDLASIRKYGNYNAPDKSYQIEVVKEIIETLYRFRFHSVDYSSGLSEHYIIGRRDNYFDYS